MSIREINPVRIRNYAMRFNMYPRETPSVSIPTSKRILERLRDGCATRDQIAIDCNTSTSGATQALNKLIDDGLVIFEPGYHAGTFRLA